MTRSKKKSSSNQSSNNMDPSQFNDSWKNVNHTSGNIADPKIQNHKKMSNVVTQNKAIKSQAHNSKENTTTQNSNRKDQSKMPDLLKQMPDWFVKKKKYLVEKLMFCILQGLLINIE